MLPVVNCRSSRIPGYEGSVFSDFFPEYVPTYSPEVNIIENDNEFNLEIAIPGIAKDEINIGVENDVLSISSERKKENEEKTDNFLHREFGRRTFKRSFGLPDSVDQELIKASYKDGVLNVIIPKKEEAKPKPAREIKIS
jgi:HSP20 family protein